MFSRYPSIKLIVPGLGFYFAKIALKKFIGSSLFKSQLALTLSATMAILMAASSLYILISLRCKVARMRLKRRLGQEIEETECGRRERRLYYTLYYSMYTRQHQSRAGGQGQYGRYTGAVT